MWGFGPPAEVREPGRTYQPPLFDWCERCTGVPHMGILVSEEGKDPVFLCPSCMEGDK